MVIDKSKFLSLKVDILGGGIEDNMLAMKIGTVIIVKHYAMDKGKGLLLRERIRLERIDY